MTKYKFTTDEASKFTKHGVDLTVYGEGVDQANVVHVKDISRNSAAKVTICITFTKEAGCLFSMMSTLKRKRLT